MYSIQDRNIWSLIEPILKKESLNVITLCQTKSDQINQAFNLVIFSKRDILNVITLNCW